MSRPLPDDVRRFILTSIPSVPYLEAMLLLRAQPQVLWDAPALARGLYVSQQRAGELLQQLAEAGFIAAEGECWRWRPSEEAHPRIERLAATYAENLLAVSELIHSREDRRARQFADAFRWRQGGKDDKENKE